MRPAGTVVSYTQAHRSRSLIAHVHQSIRFRAQVYHIILNSTLIETQNHRFPALYLDHKLICSNIVETPDRSTAPIYFLTCLQMNLLNSLKLGFA